MLMLGYLGAGVMDKKIGIPLGFILFSSFKIIYEEYAIHSKLGKILFKVLLQFGFLRCCRSNARKKKNISYNILECSLRTSIETSTTKLGN